MDAGRELDTLIAEKVMTHPHSQWRDPVPAYSTDIAAAWTVVEKLHLAVIPDASGGWRAAQEPWDGPHWYEVNVIDWEWGETAPEAICRAALATVRMLRSYPSAP